MRKPTIFNREAVEYEAEWVSFWDGHYKEYHLISEKDFQDGKGGTVTLAIIRRSRSGAGWQFTIYTDKAIITSRKYISGPIEAATEMFKVLEYVVTFTATNIIEDARISNLNITE